MSGTVKIDDVTIPFSNTSGWQLNGPRAIQLEAAACDAGRTPGQRQISVNFPWAAVTQ